MTVSLPLQLVFRAGVRSDDFIPLLMLAERAPAQLKVGLFEELRPIDRALLGAGITVAVMLLPMIALHLQPLTIITTCGLDVLLGAAFLHAYVWKLRAVLTLRARNFARVHPAEP
ncbi:hypothetical protein [Corallococcus macrosporus]|uniref:Uncharacterized protein n=1 Tax=Myxococcus fulvus (strain ATCC BAA-855 / HW-1) TaxID=483219 RepID=F8CQ72_MYXFH|nr:hypothetical protein [Corallococcus macrosporus]AEI64195.1 hypothetical protein LILAB_11420 [Corallococcus macrosporus]